VENELKHTEIASNFQNWIKHFNTNSTTEAEFDSLTMEQRLAILNAVSGEEPETPSEPCYKCGAMCAQRTCE